jgi:hypothetical protein
MVAADQGKHQALRQHLLDQARSAGAHRAPNGNLFLPSGGTRHQQVRHVGTGDEKNESYRGKEKQECRPNRADRLFVQ